MAAACVDFSARFNAALSMHKSVNMMEGSPVIYSDAIGTRPRPLALSEQRLN